MRAPCGKQDGARCWNHIRPDHGNALPEGQAGKRDGTFLAHPSLCLICARHDALSNSRSILSHSA